MEPREQAIKRLKSLTNTKEILPLIVLDKLSRQQLGLAQAVESAEELLELPGLRPPHSEVNIQHQRLLT